MAGSTVKTILNILNLGLLVLFSLALISGINLGHQPNKLGSHLGWILGAMLVWLFTVILYMMYLYRMEKFCVEIVDKYEKKSDPTQDSKSKDPVKKDSVEKTSQKQTPPNSTDFK